MEHENATVADRADGNDAGEHVDGVTIGVLAGIDERGRPLVAYADNASVLPVAAKSTVDVDPASIGREVALLFERGDPRHPLLIGIVRGSRRPVRRRLPGEEGGDDGDGADAAPRDPPATDGPATRSGQASVRGETSADVASETGSQPLSLSVDGERVLLEGRDEIVLRCGKASITLTKAGTILVRGTHVSSRASGVNRLRGGSVQIN